MLRLFRPYRMLAGLLAGCICPTFAFAGELPAVNDEAELDAFLPQSESMDSLLEKISAEPNNLEHYYKYAKAAEGLKQYKEAVWAYQSMISSDPKLDRVRLDLSLIYIQQQHFTEARKLLEEVLSHNPPAAVRSNIEATLAAIGGKTHSFAGSFTTGANFDTNAAAAPSTGKVTVFDTSLPLGSGQRKERDIQSFNALGLEHSYHAGKLTDAISLRWKTNALAYMTRQNDLSRLNTNLFTVRTGPQLTYEPLGAHLEVNAVYNYLTLDDHEYMRDPRMEINADVPLSPNLSALAGYIQEYRDFRNTTEVSTYTERSGVARQGQVGLHFVSSETSAWDGIFSLRHESTNANYQVNRQYALLASHTRLFEEGFFSMGSVGVKRSLYPVADQLISVSKRNDTELSFQLVAGKRFDKYGVVLSAGYTYLQNRSSIQNYRYDNHRVSVSATKNF